MRISDLIPRRVGALKLVEQGSVRWRSRRGHVLVKIHDDLRYYLALRGPEAEPETVRDLRRAQSLVERRVGYIPLPLEGHGPSDSALELLADANALCAEYLSYGSLTYEGRISRLISRTYHREVAIHRAAGLRIPHG